MKNLAGVGYLICLLVFLAACGAPATLTPSPAVLLLPSSTPTQTVGASPTETEIPALTVTFTLPAAPILTVVPTLTIHPDATLSTIQTIEAVSATTCRKAELSERSPVSPDGKWAALQCGATSKRADYTEITRLDGTASWKISFYETYGKFVEIQDGKMKLYHWSNDSQFAYFIPYFCCADAPGDDYFNYFRISAALYRLDLTTGRITTTLAPDNADIFAGYAFAFSPNDKYLAYREHSDQLTLYTLKTGEMQKINLKDSWLYGGFAWSADSKKIAFVTSHTDSTYDYYLFQIGESEPRRLIEAETVYRLNWLDSERLLFGESMLYDLATNSFIPLPTPTP